MKLILTGATGFVGSECLRFALKNPQVTEVVALARREVKLPEGSSDAEKSKFTTVVLADMGQDYPSSVKEKLRGADACIWNIAITPDKLAGMSEEEVKKICNDYTTLGLKAMTEVANPDHPFRFVYTSGALTERNQDRSLWLMSEHRKMRGEVENAVHDFAAKSTGKAQVQVTKPGHIHSDENSFVVRRTMLWLTIGLPYLHVKELAATEVEQAVKGFEKDVLENDGCVRIGREALKGYDGNAPILLFRLEHDGSPNGYFQPTPNDPSNGIVARDPTAVPTKQLLASHLQWDRVATCFISFATWDSTPSGLRKWFSLDHSERPRNIRLYAVLMPLVQNIKSVANVFDLAKAEGLNVKKYMRNHWIIRGQINANEFLVKRLPTANDFRLVYLPIDRYHRVDRNGTLRSVPGIFRSLPAVLVSEMPHQCYSIWQSHLLAQFGPVGGRFFDALLDAVTTDSPKLVADFQQGGGALAPVSRAALKVLDELLGMKWKQH